MSKTWLVGEDNPLSPHPRDALYPYPPNCAGERLQRLVLAVSHEEYFRDFVRANLCVGGFRLAHAREVAREVLLHADGSAVVLLGARVANAFRVPYEPFTVRQLGPSPVAVIPHPSGRSRAWNDPRSFALARAAVECARSLVSP